MRKRKKRAFTGAYAYDAYMEKNAYAYEVSALISSYAYAYEKSRKRASLCITVA